MKRTRSPKPPDNPTPFAEGFGSGYEYIPPKNFGHPLYPTKFRAWAEHIVDLAAQCRRTVVGLMRELSLEALKKIQAEHGPFGDLRTRKRIRWLGGKIDRTVSSWIRPDRVPPNEPDPLDMPRGMFPGDRAVGEGFDVVDEMEGFLKALTERERARRRA